MMGKKPDQQAYSPEETCQKPFFFFKLRSSNRFKYSILGQFVNTASCEGAGKVPENRSHAGSQASWRFPGASFINPSILFWSDETTKRWPRAFCS